MVFQRILGFHIIIGVNVFIFVGLATTYALSVISGHLKPLWCFISYTGDYAIESCIFSAVFNLCSVGHFLIVYFRYIQLSDELSHQDLSEKLQKKMHFLNLISLLFGILGALGVSMTGCFQNRLFHIMHITGVFFCSYFVLVYFILQTYFSFTFMSPLTVYALRIFRLLIVIFSSCILFAGPFFFLYYLINYPQVHHPIKPRQDAVPEDLIYKLGVVLEWVLFFLNHMFIFSLYPDFKRIALKKDEITFLE